MKTFIKKQFIILLLLSLAIGLEAQTRYTVEDVPNVQLEDYTRYVSDPEDALEIGDIIILDERAAELRDSMNVQSAIVVLPAIDTDHYGSAKEFATELFNTWGIGDKETNNGLLILLLTADGEREVVFETGYGVEEKLTDGMCKLIQTNKMIPFLKEGEYGEGLIAGVEEVEKVLNGTSDLITEPTSIKDLKWPFIIWIVVGILALYLTEKRKRKLTTDTATPYAAAIKQTSMKDLGCVATVLFFPVFLLYKLFKGKGANAAAINCEKCRAQGTVKLQKGEPAIKQQAIPGQDGMKEYEFVCSKCGFVHRELVPYTYVKPQTESDSSGSTTYRSSSSRGGSWGGGRSGGGGASTKF